MNRDSALQQILRDIEDCKHIFENVFTLCVHGQHLLARSLELGLLVRNPEAVPNPTQTIPDNATDPEAVTL